MPDEPSFEWNEDLALSGSTTWTLRGRHIHIAGIARDSFQPVVVTNRQVKEFLDALDFIDIWNWKQTYHFSECDVIVRDGMTWSFTALIDGRSCYSSGNNAYPSFRNAQDTSLEKGRYPFLVYALHSIFDVDEQLYKQLMSRRY